MKEYAPKDIRNVVIAGHSGKGKTTLAEAILYTAKATDRLGRVADGNTVLDFDAEEKRRKATITTAMAAFEWKNTKINLLDTPGLFDFAGGVAEGIRAAESVIIVLSAGSDIDVGAEKAYKAASNAGIAKIFAVTRCDAENTDFYKTFNALKDKYGASVCPVVVPYMVGGKVDCYVDFSLSKAFKYNNGTASEVPAPSDDVIEEMKMAFTEAVAGADDDLMEKFFSEEPMTDEEIAMGLRKGIASGDICPVYACAGYTCDAVDLILGAIVNSAPAADTCRDFGGEDGAVSAVCFKTVDDRFGKMSFFKVVSGKISANMTAYNLRADSQERVGKMLFLKGEKQEDTLVIPAGDIGVVTKLDSFKTGDTLSSSKTGEALKGVEYPEPCLSKAVRAKKKGEEDKVASGLIRISSEDPTVAFSTNAETHEQIVSVLGEQHLDSVVNKLKNKFNVEVELKDPKVAYRETISAKYDAHGRHKKQSGGSGQFGDVWVRFEPMEGDGFEFLDEVVGGAVPRNFIPSVEKGLRLAIEKGPLTGSKVVGIRAALHDGQSHPVDSNDMAFQTAARLAFKEAMTNAKPKLLEPIGVLKAYMPDSNLGDIMGDVTKRRGRVLGMGPSEDDQSIQELVAEVPMAEMGDFATVLRSVTIGRGFFKLEFDHYEICPDIVAQKVIDEFKASQAEE
ncbi:MAG: elongation factor G [Clostridiales bacterium]|nr:elongation factor G [Clostridiales bacterium]